MKAPWAPCGRPVVPDSRDRQAPAAGSTFPGSRAASRIRQDCARTAIRADHNR
ncbi:hypothetical protein UCMB321_3788 [Pseudomonas batumici]|uniref:Uncharacterized protein n=1 Tax=Pseudomonas batumici TaxID=226910 RepID=A0A0C2E999_9PSED|nr:hypothetical protein UCMB321_3788 [Pseudomonas batumici]